VIQTFQEYLHLRSLNSKRMARFSFTCGFAAAMVSMALATTSTSSTSTKQKTTHHATAKSSTHSSSAHSKSSTHKGKKSTKAAGKHGQQKIDAERTQQIQEALIREHYLDGQSSGQWDDATQKAMQKYQADNGWQSKTVPDSRALIKMGLGPNQDHLLNPESAMTAAPSQHPAAMVDPTSEKFPALASQPQR
jgi:hypothetical protein